MTATAIARPQALPVSIANLPDELKAYPQWVGWEYESREDTWTKPPRDPRSWKLASTTDSETWGTYIDAVGGYHRGRGDGFGFVLTKGDPFFAVDLDKCIDDDGNVPPWAAAIVKRMPIYWERSPSGRGLRGIGRGTLPSGRRRTGAIEMYDDLRFVTLTGQVIDEHSEIGEDATTQLAALHADVFGKTEPDKERPASTIAPADDMEIVERCRRFKNGATFEALMRGNTSAYDGDDSAADAALIERLLFANGGDIGQAVRIASTSPLWREKWESKRGDTTYIEYTARNILAKMSEFYEPPSTPREAWRQNGHHPSGGPNTPVVTSSRPMPVDCLPDALRQLAEGTRDTLGIPAEYVAVTGLGVLAGAIGNALELEVKRGWRERANVWLGIVGAPGASKSPAIDIASRPLAALQSELREHWQTALETWQEEDKATRGPAPHLEIIEATDSTIEGVARVLERSRGLLLKADELVSWIAGHHRYRGKNASERGEWLKLWAGGNLIVVRSTKIPLVIDRPNVALIGGIQPARLLSLAGDQPGEFTDDGMLDRFLIAWPETKLALWNENELPRDVTDSWADVVRQLRGWKPAYTSAEGNRDVVRLTPDAMALWSQWHDSNLLSIDGATGLTRGWAAKAPRHLLRLALLLHAGNNPGEPKYDVDIATLEAAIELIEWFREQHGGMLAALKVGQASQPAGVAGRMLRQLRMRGRLSRSELNRALGNVRVEEFDRAIDELVDGGWIGREQEAGRTKPAEFFFLLHSDSVYSELLSRIGVLSPNSQNPNPSAKEESAGFEVADENGTGWL